MQHFLSFKFVLLLLFTASVAEWDRLTNQCTFKKLNSSSDDCVYEVMCNDYIDDSLNNRLHCYDRYRGRNFNTKVNFLTIKKTKSDYSDNRRIVYSYDYALHNIYSLDLSGNEYSSVPVVPSMPDLQSLNLSKNSFLEANFYNEHKLPLLSEIDYSHNIINTITVDIHKYPYKNLKKINLSHNYLVAIEDAIFDSFSELDSLDLSYNFIDSLSFLTFEGIKNLENLNLKHNRLSELNSALLRFNKLKVLDLSENKIANLQSVDINKLVNLKTLDVSANLIEHIDKKVFDTLNLLERLDLSDNKLECIDAGTFANVSNLVNINLSKNNFRTLPKKLFKENQISVFSVKDNNLEGSLVRGTFEGLKLVTELDLSHQKFVSIEDYAFFGLENLDTLLLNNNYLNILSKKSFMSLRKLEILDLSNNQLSNIDFDKDDLISLQSLLLKNNFIIQIKEEHFRGLNMMQFLDLSDNNISHFDSNSFKSLRDLINLQISNNPVTGALEASTFEGLNSLPSLDISNTNLTTVKNNSFSGMTQLKDLNLSHSKIYELQYNALSQTGLIETLDLSFNELKEFIINTTELINIQTLILNNNCISAIASASFKSLSRLNKVILSHNKVLTVSNEAFQDQSDMRYLDLSFNNHLVLNVSQFERVINMADLLLSGIKSYITFHVVKELRLSRLEISYSDISNVTTLDLKKVKNIDELILSNNNLSRIEVNAFTGVSSLRKLDLSFNKITFIQPGSFKDNVLLQSLNISHNNLVAISYGIFRGLLYLDTIDMSYNEIKDLQRERFYEVHSLSMLIADHNKIETLNVDDFSGTSLSTLSIGENPIPCHEIVNFKRASSDSLTVTAIKLDENSNENVDGVICNMDNSVKLKYKDEHSFGSERVLMDIKGILQNMSKLERNDAINSTFGDFKYLHSFTDEIEKVNVNINSSMNNTRFLVQNVSSTITEGSKSTNVLLEKIYRVLTSTNNIRRIDTTVSLPKGDNTSLALTQYINKIKQDMEDTIALEKQNILNELDTKIAALNSHKVAMPAQEAYSGYQSSDSKSYIFIEVCVGLILVILIVFILYKFYNSGMFVPTRYSVSTRHLPDAIENSAL